MRIDNITPEQSAKFSDWSRKWIDIGLSTAPADFDKATTAALKAYELCNLGKPMVILRMGSPYGATLGGALAWAMLREIGSKKLGKKVWSQVESQVRSQVRSQVESQVESQVRSQVWSQVESQVRSQVWSQVWSQVGSQVGSQVRSQVWSQVESQLRDAAYYNQRGGAFWASWCGYVTFIRDVLGWRDPILERCAIDEALAESCGWVWWHENVLAISDRPTYIELDDAGRLHSALGPSIAYRDGWALHHWHGVSVPADVIEKPEGISIDRIKAEGNAEIRRVMIERYGYDRYCVDAGLRQIQECSADHDIVGLRAARLWRDDANGIVLLDMLNSTPEPDGSVKRYILPVDPQAYDGRAGHECLAAMASTWRRADYSLYFRSPEEYAPIAES